MPKQGVDTAAVPKNKSAGFRSRRNTGPAARQSNRPAPQPNVTAPAASATARSAPPLPKRNKGRFFVGTVFFVFFAFVAYVIWTAFFQYQSYGVIEGRLISVSSPSNGVVINWQVKEGQEVEQGQPLAEISNLSMRHELEALLDDLKLNQAQLEAESAKLEFLTKSNHTASEKAYAEYLQASGELEGELAQFEDVRKQLQRARRLVKSKNFPQQKYDKLYFEYIGQQRKIEKLKLAARALKSRFELAKEEQHTDRHQQLQPMLAKIELIQSEIKRIREKIQQGLLLAPVTGRVTKRFLLTGESVQESEPVIELLENNSTEAILYVPQERIDRFQVGSTIAVELPPFDKKIHCEVIRLSHQMEVPPGHIAKYYAEDTVLLPVHLQPLPEYEQFLSFRINGMIKLPINYGKQLSEQIFAIGEEVKEFVSGFGQSPSQSLHVEESLGENDREKITMTAGFAPTEEVD